MEWNDQLDAPTAVLDTSELFAWVAGAQIVVGPASFTPPTHAAKVCKKERQKADS
jgi:hypothetical protein